MSWESRLEGSRTIGNENPIIVPTRSDYVQAIVEEGLIASEYELASQPDLVVAIHRHWVKQLQVGCVYARALNTKPEAYNIEAVVIPNGSDSDPGEIAKLITTVTTSAAQAPGVEAISILLPAFTDLQMVCTLVWTMCSEERWHLRADRICVDAESKETYLLFGMDYVQDDLIPSAVLGIGPYYELPLTRQGPITCLEVRVKSTHAQYIGKRPGTPLVSHLAQIPFPQQGVFAQEGDPTWQQTQKLKREVLGHDDPRAKAEVTFAFPWQIWKAAIV